MSKALIVVVGCAAASIVAGAAFSAGAADREFCRDYARSAVGQVRSVMHHMHCAENLDRQIRWSADYRTHFQWCLNVSKDTANDERRARHEALERCPH